MLICSLILETGLLYMLVWLLDSFIKVAQSAATLYPRKWQKEEQYIFNHIIKKPYRCDCP